MLSREEVAGVLAHELSHIKNRDTLTMTAAASLGGAISMIAQYLQFGALFGRGSGSRFGWLGFLFAALVAPFAAMLVQLAISRSREYQADRMGAMIRAAGVAGVGTGEDPRGGAAHPQSDRRGAPVERAPVHRQPVDRARR